MPPSVPLLSYSLRLTPTQLLSSHLRAFPGCLKHRRTLSYHPSAANSHTCSPASHSCLVETPRLPVTGGRRVISALCPSSRSRTSRPHDSSLRTPSSFIHNKAPPISTVQRPISADPPAISPDRHHRRHPKQHLHPDDRHCFPRHVFFRPVFLYVRPSQRRPRPQTRRSP